MLSGRSLLRPKGVFIGFIFVGADIIRPQPADYTATADSIRPRGVRAANIACTLASSLTGPERQVCFREW